MDYYSLEIYENMFPIDRIVRHVCLLYNDQDNEYPELLLDELTKDVCRFLVRIIIDYWKEIVDDRLLFHQHSLLMMMKNIRYLGFYRDYLNYDIFVDDEFHDR